MIDDYLTIGGCANPSLKRVWSRFSTHLPAATIESATAATVAESRLIPSSQV